MTVHQRAHQDILQATGVEIAGRDKVRRFLITLKVSFFVVGIAMVKATPHLQTDWDECINFLWDFILVKGSGVMSVGIAGLGVGADPSSDEDNTGVEAAMVGTKKGKCTKGKGQGKSAKKKKLTWADKKKTNRETPKVED